MKITMANVNATIEITRIGQVLIALGMSALFGTSCSHLAQR